MTSDVVFVSVVLIVSVALALLPVVRAPAVLLTLIIARSVVDVGSSSGAPPLPNGLLNGAIAVALLVLVLVTAGSRLPEQLIPLVGIAVAMILFGMVVGLLRFGTSSGSIPEAVRLLSAVAVFVVAARIGVQQAPQTWQLVVPILPPTLLLLGGSLIGSSLFLQSDGRVLGTFSHANAAAAFMSVAALSCLSVWFFARSRALLWVGLASVVALILTQSLGGLAGLLAGILVVMVINTRIAFSARLVAVLAITTCLVAVTAFTRLGDRIFAFRSPAPLAPAGDEDSLAWRFQNWTLLLQDWHQSPWFGYGLGATSTQLMPLGAPPHSLPVQLLVETGVFGAVVAVAVLVLVLVRLVTLAVAGRWEASVLLGLVALCVVNGSESNLIGYTATVYLLMLVAGLLAARCCQAADAEVARTPRRLAGVLA